MKKVTTLSLLAVAVLTASCNEKVSPELESTSVSTPDTTTVVAPTEYYFKVENTSPTLLNFNLHKTGSGNTSTACEVSRSTELSNLNFSAGLDDITCYFDAEELSLFHGGMSFEISASKNTCDFVGYSPFSFYDRIPGDSSGNLTQIECMNETTSNAHVKTAADARGISDDTFAGADTLGCGDWATTDLADGTRVKFSPQNDDELCRFNYQDKDEEKCDIGVINVTTLQVTYTPPSDPSDPTTEILQHEIVNRTVRCGGAVANCVKGPIELIKQDVTRTTEVTAAEFNKDFAKEYTLPALYGTYASNKRYANYRRDLASLDIDFITRADADYNTKWNDATYGKLFNSRLMDFYSANKMMDGSTLVTDATLDTYSYPGNMYKAVPLAAEPYIGMRGNRVNPFYTFYCFDTAYDIKARIKMVVREWDRVFPSTADNEYLSDLFRGPASSRQDNPTEVEIASDEDFFIPYNDLEDWDDKIPMERTSGAYSSTLTIWRPVTDATYLDGWFNPENFTNNDY